MDSRSRHHLDSFKAHSKYWWSVLATIPGRRRRIVPNNYPLVAVRRSLTAELQLDPVYSCNSKPDPGYALLEPGLYEIGGQNFDLSQPGYYYFSQVGRFSRQLVVAASDVLETLGLITNLWICGQPDDSFPRDYGGRNRTIDKNDFVGSKITAAPVMGGCVALSSWSVAILGSLNIEARVVAAISTGEWFGQDDGHTLVEFRNPISGHWNLFDPSYGLVIPHNLVEACLQGESLELIDLCCKPSIAQWRTSDFDYQLWLRSRSSVFSVRHEWFQRVLNIPLLQDRNQFYFAHDLLDQSMISRLQARGYHAVSMKDVMMNWYQSDSGSADWPDD